MKLKRKLRRSFMSILILILILAAVDEYYDDKRYESLERIMLHRTHLDSLYWDHISECAFIRNEDIVVGYNNYLQVIHVKGKGEIK